MTKRHGMSESDGEEERNVSTSTSEVLGKVVDDASEYLAVKEPGALSLYDLHPKTELYLVSIPSNLLDPMKLVHAEMVVGGSKEREVVVGRQRYGVASYSVATTTQLPSLFLPDRNGALHKVPDGRIKTHVVLRGQPHVEVNEEGVEYVDLAALCSTRHLPPSDLKTRHFLAPKRESVRSPEQRIRKKKRKREEEQEEDSPRVSKKKKSERNKSISSASPHQVAKGGDRGRVTTEVEISQDFIGLTQGNKEYKMSKNHKTVAGEVVVKKEKLEENNWSLGDDHFYSPKKKKTKSKKDKLDVTC